MDNAVCLGVPNLGPRFLEVCGVFDRHSVWVFLKSGSKYLVGMSTTE